MFGTLALVVQILFVLAPLVCLIAELTYVKNHKADLRSWAALIALIPITMLWLPIIGSQLYHESADFLYLSTLKPEEIANIGIGEAQWHGQAQIQRLVVVLNHPVWHVVNHDNGGPLEPITITMRSGQNISFRIGRYNIGDGAVTEFYRPYGTGTWEDGGPFIPNLATVLESLGHSLPANAK